VTTELVFYISFCKQLEKIVALELKKLEIEKGVTLTIFFLDLSVVHKT